jgi:hypothetical protein
MSAVHGSPEEEEGDAKLTVRTLSFSVILNYLMCLVDLA